MITLTPGDTLAGVAGAANVMTVTVFGDEYDTVAAAHDYKVLYQGQLPNAIATLYTVPANHEAYIKTIEVVNLDNDEQTFQLAVKGTAAANRITPLNSLRPQAMAQYEDFGWSVVGVRGSLLTQSFTTLQDANYSSLHAETFDRNYALETNTAALVSQRITVQAIWLTAGQIIRWITFHSATTALATGVNQVFGLYDLARNKLCETVDGTGGAWAANTIKTLQVTSPYTVPTTGLYYLVILVNATTVPTLKGGPALTGGQLHSIAPQLNGTADTGVTSLPATMAALVPNTTVQVWGAVG